MHQKGKANHTILDKNKYDIFVCSVMVDFFITNCYHGIY